MILLDTCALLWWTLDPAKLSPEAVKACLSMDLNGGVLSSISIWEVGIKVKRKKLSLPFPLTEYVARLKKLSMLRIIPVDENIWVENLKLPWENPDPADRTIVATAQMMSLPIVTKDEHIRKYYPQTIW